jgi:hypothetical protein
LTPPSPLAVTAADAEITVTNQYNTNFANIADRADSPPYNQGPRSATSYSQPSRIPFSEGSGRRGPIAPAAILFLALAIRFAALASLTGAATDVLDVSFTHH